MIDFFTSRYADFIVLMKTYPWMAGAVSLWGMGVLTYMLKYIPTFYNFIIRQIQTTLEINNAGNSGNEMQFKSFMKWYLKSPYSKWSRYLSLDGNNNWWEEDAKYIIGPGYGNHFFFYKKRLYWFSKSSLNSQGSEKEKQTILIKTFGRSQKPILELIADFTYKPKKEDICIYTFEQGWKILTSIKKRNINSVVLRKDIKDSLLHDMQYFFDNRTWYYERGLAYKQTFVLHGKPGTGKSSTIKSLASHYNKNICIIDLSMMTNASFEAAMSNVPQDSIVLIEDFDSCDALHDRTQKDESQNIKLMEDYSPLTLSKILNVMDGVVSLDGTLIFFTTNHLEKIDPAMIRKGRVDYIYEIPYLEDTEIREYAKLMYGEIELPDCIFDTIAGCDLQALFLECKENSKEFISRLDTVSVECDNNVIAA